MGYDTHFDGLFKLDRPLTPEHAEYLRAFARSRRMKRDPAVAATLPDPLRVAAGLPIGPDGGYFVGTAMNNCGQAHDSSVVDYNDAPNGQPGLWCQWTPTIDRTGVMWDGNDGFYCYVEWLEYLLAHFLKPWGYVLAGEVHWQGEDAEDFGRIRVVRNQVTTSTGRRVYD